MSGGVVSYDSQVPRNSLYWLLLAQFVLILPHLQLLPRWLSVACLACGVWRVQIYRGKLTFASTWQRILLLVAAFGGVLSSYFQHLGLDTIIAFLILVFFLKLLETRCARDMYVTIFLGYFIAATQVMYDSSLWSLVYAITCYLLLSVALLTLHQPELNSIGASLRRSGTLLLQGLPVLLVLFVLFPRIDPLWQALTPDQQTRAGVGDSIELGTFGRLAQTDEVAFRVNFEGAIPPPETLYWRGLVFEDFDGRTWRIAPESQAALPSDDTTMERLSGHDGQASAGQPPSGKRLDYSVILEPGHQQWLFAIPLAQAPGKDADRMLTTARTLRLRQAAGGRYQYRVRSFPEALVQVQPSEAELARNLRLPEAGNEGARALGRQLHERYKTPLAISAALMDRFRRDTYYYTLRPPVYQHDSIDGFLLDSKRGYCEHYAAAFVYVMRSAGVPARLVGGYLGGERNPFESYLAVRQMDAHAWAEVWLAGRGWVRQDPTAAVAPERVLDGVDAVLMGRDEYSPGGLLGLGIYRQLAWLQTTRLWWDAVGYGWAHWVLNYDRESQMRLMENWFGRGDLAMLLRCLAIALSTAMALSLLWLLRGTFARRYTGPQRAALLFSWLLGRLGSTRTPAESMVAYCARVASHYPSLAPTLAEFAACWSALSYADLQYPWKRRVQLYGQLGRLAWQVIGLRLRRSRPGTLAVSGVSP